MSAKAISEFTGKELLYRHLEQLTFLDKPRAVSINENENFETATQHCDWLTSGGKVGKKH